MISSNHRLWLRGFGVLAVGLLLPPAFVRAQTVDASISVGAGPAVAKISRRRNIMRRIYRSLLPIALFLVLVPSALASTTWYVDGVNGNDGNNCQTPQTACKTIGHGISLAALGRFHHRRGGDL